MIKIRLTQTGTRNQKKYRIVAMEEYKRRNGKYIELLGYYNPTVKPPEIEVKKDRVTYWIGKGAQITEAVKKLI